jgi:hypothetical protein
MEDTQGKDVKGRENRANQVIRKTMSRNLQGRGQCGTATLGGSPIPQLDEQRKEAILPWSSPYLYLQGSTRACETLFSMSRVAC